MSENLPAPSVFGSTMPLNAQDFSHAVGGTIPNVRDERFEPRANVPYSGQVFGLPTPPAVAAREAELLASAARSESAASEIATEASQEPAGEAIAAPEASEAVEEPKKAAKGRFTKKANA